VAIEGLQESLPGDRLANKGTGPERQCQCLLSQDGADDNGDTVCEGMLSQLAQDPMDGRVACGLGLD